MNLSNLAEKFDSRYVVGFVLVLFVFPGIELPGVRVILPLGVFVTSLMTIVLIATGRIKLNDRFVFALALFATVLTISGLFGFIFIDVPEIPEGTVESNWRFSRLRFIWQIGAWGVGFSSVLYFAYVFRSARLLDKFRSIVLVGGTFVCVYAAYELFSAWIGWPVLLPSWGIWTVDHDAVVVIDDIKVSRLYGTFAEPKEFARFLLYPLFIASMLWIVSGRRLILLLTLGLFGVFVMTFSTAAIAGFVVGSAIFIGLNLAVRTHIHRKVYPFLFAGIVIGVIAVAAIFGSGRGSFITHHIARVDDVFTADITTGTDRLPGQTIRGRTFSVSVDYLIGWDRGINLFLDYPIFGVGLGNSIYFMNIWDRLFTPFSVHILLLAETGIIGYTFFIFMIGIIVYPMLRSLARRSNPLTIENRLVAIPLISGFAASLVTYQMHGGARFDPTDWLILGVLIAVARLTIEQPGYRRP